MTLVDTLKSEWIALTTIGICIVLILLAAIFSDLWFLPIVATLMCSITIIKEIISDIRRSEISAVMLATAALIAGLILGEYIIAAEIAIVIAVGNLLETVVADHATSSIQALGKVKTQRAHVINGNNIYNLPLEDVRVGKHIRVYPGEIIPLYGIIIQGDTSVDKSIMTGESIPVDAVIGDEVFSGTCNLNGTIDVEVTRCDADGMLGHMSSLLKYADAGKNRIVGAADRWAKYILVVAAVLTVGTCLITDDLRRGMTIMMVLCPCAFVLAAPAGIMAAAMNMDRNGVLLKEPSSIEGMNKVDMILFDKTGTLTSGIIHSLGFTNVSQDMPSEKIEGLVASLESRSEHPLGMAISADYEQNGHVEEFMDIPGKGVKGIVDGVRIAAGNADLMSYESPIGLEEALEAAKESSCTVVYIGIDGRCVGFFSLEDTLKECAHSTVEELEGEGLKTVMLTGDSKAVAQKTADRLGIDLIVWDCKPETKLSSVEEFERTGRACMLGDGMNDAPSLRRATVGVSMGVMGNDVSVKASDIVLLKDDISKIPGVYRLCKRSVKTVFASVVIAAVISIAGATLALLGTVDPIMVATVHITSSVIVMLAASTLLWAKTWAPEHQGKTQ